MFYKDERLALFIDGSSLHGAGRALGIDIDYKLLRDEFARRGRLVRAHYYTCVSDTDEFSPVKPLTDWLGYNGFTVLAKPVREYVDAGGRKKVKGAIGIELATDALLAAPHVDHVVLFSGDGDFRSLVQGLQRLGKRVSVASTLKSSTPMASDDLRRQADNFIDIDDLRDVIGRTDRAAG
ncbi:hypothetical protein OCH239_10880 [Roseivivax halodurans JCM 10272]|uniref:NYN domain-containing protein n=1 Tax=Roseivivax halodurans JCM 10272 TaxID=1449350 RepID=X7EB79_9RHOB|nr:NYN domain-containing protein [Roseivivax halodurans]ETX13339.1 hypothetical protein OCH239_10880 [Roseivivax halodurans JCM 10272]